MSPTTSALGFVRVTAAVWRTMTSTVTESVSSKPSTALPTESPTSMMSAPARSAIRADGASYAVMTAIFSPPLRARMAGAVILSGMRRGSRGGGRFLMRVGVSVQRLDKTEAFPVKRLHERVLDVIALLDYQTGY